MFGFILPLSRYHAAEDLFRQGDDLTAKAAYESARWYGGAKEKALLSQYRHAETPLANGQYNEAAHLFLQPGSYADAADCRKETFYRWGESLLAVENTTKPSNASSRQAITATQPTARLTYPTSRPSRR